jgi:uncharacterized protein
MTLPERATERARIVPFVTLAYALLSRFAGPRRLGWLQRWLLWRRWILWASVLLGVLALARTVLTYANLRTEFEELLPDSAPSVGAAKVAKERLYGLRHLGIVVEAVADAPADRARGIADELGQRIEAYPPTLVTSLRKDSTAERSFFERRGLELMAPEDVATLRKAVEERRDWEVSRHTGLSIEDEDAPAPQLPLKELQKKYSKQLGLDGDEPTRSRFESADGRVQVLIVQTPTSLKSHQVDRDLLRRVRADIASLRLEEGPGHVQIGYAGDVASRIEETDGLVADLGLSSVLVTVAVALVVALFYRSWRAIPVLGLPLALGTCLTFLVVALPPLGIVSLNSNTAFLGAIIVGNGINSGIILLARFREELQGGLCAHPAMRRAVEATWRPTLAASIAASAAYGSLLATDFRGFEEFGWLGGIGMLVCWLVNYALIPLIGGFYLGEATRPPSVADKAEAPFSERLAAQVLSGPRLVLAFAVVTVLACAIGLWQRRHDPIEYDVSRLRRADSWVNGERYWAQRMDAVLGRYLTPAVVMTDSPEQARRVAERLKELQAQGRAGGLIATVRTLEDVLPSTTAISAEEAKRIAKAVTPKLRDRLTEEQKRILDKALAPDNLRPVQVSELPASFLMGLRSRDGSVDRNVLVFPRLGAGSWDASRVTAFASDLRAAATIEGTAHPVASAICLSADIASALTADGPRATWVSLGIVLVVCLLAFRSLGYSVLAMVTLAIGVTWMLGAMAWSGQRLNVSNFVALPITFGIAADYSINMLRRYKSDGAANVRRALAGSGGAIGLCSLTTIIGFGSLLGANNRALFSFGLFAVTGEITCLAAALTALPAMIILRQRAGRDET